MNRRTLCAILVAFFVLGNAACGGGGSHHNSTLTVVISSVPTTLAVGATGNVVATVTNDSSNGGVTWSCTPAPCSASSFNPSTTASGAASVFTAPAAIPSGGQVTITATSVTDTSVSKTAKITITGSTVNSQNFSFYVSGVALNDEGHDPYDVAGVVSIATDGSGTVVGGVQDYNDGDAIASPQPQGDAIMSGSLVMAANGQGTLTLLTNNPKLGVAGTETFAVAFSNANHALITQFDGSATSSGSIDLQTSTATPSGAFSFVAVGVGSNEEPLVEAGVATVDSTGNVTGIGDINDAGAVTLGVPIPAGAALSAPDAFGRGTITTDTIIFGTVNYYTVSPKVFRIVQTEANGAVVGSAYSQGASPNFSNASIGTSVFSLGQNFDFYAAAGQFTTASVPALRSGAAVPTANFTGVGDLNEIDGALLPAAPITGTYTLAANGRGSMSFDEGFGDVALLGIYAVDPTLNILDPNDTTDTASAGGALLAEIDANLAGIGVLIPQTSPASFTGAYTFGAQGRSGATNGFEFDFLGEATVTAGAFTGTGALSDPFATLTGTANEFSGVSFTSTATPDADNPGRLTFSPVALSGTGFASPVKITVTAYQANGGQLLLVQMDSGVESGGSMEQNTLAPAATVRTAKPQVPKH